MSDAEKVKQFTEESGTAVPRVPRSMKKAEVEFLIRMCSSELVELAQTVCNGPVEAVEMVQKAANTDLKPHYEPPLDQVQLMADQADALVDMWYYGLNAFTKCGINLSKVFDVVHEANMAKRFPDGLFHKRTDGKIIKPSDWKEPNIRDVVDKQCQNGAF